MWLCGLCGLPSHYPSLICNAAPRCCIPHIAGPQWCAAAWCGNDPVGSLTASPRQAQLAVTPLSHHWNMFGIPYVCSQDLGPTCFSYPIMGFWVIPTVGGYQVVNKWDLYRFPENLLQSQSWASRHNFHFVILTLLRNTQRDKLLGNENHPSLTCSWVKCTLEDLCHLSNMIKEYLKHFNKCSNWFGRDRRKSIN
jgi:hypothetical protein